MASEQNNESGQDIDIFNAGNCIAIVSLRTFDDDPRPQVYYQVTIDQANFTDDKSFIRLGDVHGDELTGWRPVTDLVIHKILFEYGAADIPYIEKTVKVA